MKRLAVFLFSLIWSASAFGQASQRVSSSIDHQTLSIRGLGMGGAMTAVVDDYNALAFNPAALAYLETFQVHGTIGLAIDNDIQTIYDDITTASDLDNDTDATNAIIEAIEKQFGKEPYVRLTPLYGAWVWKNWGFSFTPADLTLELGVDQQIGPSLSVSGNLDTTIMLGYAREIKSRKAKLAWGVTGKLVHRVFYQDTLSAAQLAEDSDLFRTEDADEGLTLDFDVGFLYSPRAPSRGFFKFIKYLKPTIGVTVRNVVDHGFGTNFNLVDDNSGEPPKLGRRFDVGTKLELPKWWVFTPRFAFDVRDMGHENWTFKKGYHAGFELDWFVGHMLRGAYRVGLNQGYWTAGVTAKLVWFQLDIASWGEEIGTSNSSKENRRWMLNASLDF